MSVVCHYKKRVDVARRRQTPYDVARLHLIVPMEPWQNFTPFFGAAAFCTTKIDDFRASLTPTFSDIIVGLLMKEARIK